MLPRKATAQLAVGRIAGNYWYDGSQTDSYKRHVRDVQWIRTDIPRTSVKQDLLYSLGAFSTYCEVSRNEAAARIAELARTGADPGTRIAAAKPFAHPKSVSAEDDAAAAAADTSPIDLEEYAQGRIAANIQERFSGHGMAVLVEAVLTARGYTCWRSPEGADGGVDLLAGSGPLGLDAPRLVVQVKSEQNPVGDPVLNQLIGSTTKHGTGAQGLLVAWGGLTQPAARSARDNYFRLRVWTAVDLINQLTANYGALPEEIRSEVVLKQIWVPVEDES